MSLDTERLPKVIDWLELKMDWSSILKEDVPESTWPFIDAIYLQLQQDGYVFMVDKMYEIFGFAAIRFAKKERQATRIFIPTKPLQLENALMEIVCELYDL